jgi:hypothetical protein
MPSATTNGNPRFLRASVLSARPDLKKYTALRFHQNVKRHADAIGSGEALELNTPLTLVCRDFNLERQGYLSEIAGSYTALT